MKNSDLYLEFVYILRERKTLLKVLKETSQKELSIFVWFQDMTYVFWRHHSVHLHSIDQLKATSHPTMIVILKLMQDWRKCVLQKST